VAPVASPAAARALAAALSTFRAGEHGPAVLELTEIVARFPDPAPAAEAQWWIGEANDRPRDFRHARVECPRVADADPAREAAARARTRRATSRAR
jgi:TolA-binding protein